MGRVRRRLGRYKRQILGQPLPPKRVPTRELSPLDRKRRELLATRVMGPESWTWLSQFLLSADQVLPLRDAVRLQDGLPTRGIALRHDIDHDIENAVRLAELEAEIGITSSYYPLHTAWYYRWESKGQELSKLMLDALAKIASLGHEIGLHNNAVRVGLDTGEDPIKVLEREIEQLRGHGFDVVGTAAHGDSLVLASGVVNYDVFAERGEAPRHATWTDPNSGKVYETSFTPVKMADLGLEYESYTVPHKLYLADSGGRWEYLPEYIEQEFERGKGPLQILTHPIYWAVSGEHVPPRNRPLSMVRRSTPSPKPLRIIARGDCCSRRAVEMNPEFFGDKVDYIKDEKSRTDFFVEHPYVGSPTAVDMQRYVRVEDINNRSHRYYQLCQTDRGTMTTRGADLIMMDSYGDMNFQAWHHREKGWKLWAPMAFLRDKEKFMQEFESVGYLSLEQSVAYHVQLIEHYRLMNGHIPVLFLNQPIAYFDKLAPRSEFRQLGAELEKVVPDLFYGVIDDDDLDPDDMDSSGPGQTLHFTGKTYLKMIDVAMEKGLDKWLPRATANFPS